MSSAGTGGGAPVGSGILPGGPAPGTGPTVNPVLDKVAALVDWFGQLNNNIFDGMALTSVLINLADCNPAIAMVSLVSLKPLALLAFLGFFPLASVPQGLTRFLMFPCTCPRVLGALSPFDTGCFAHSNKVVGGSCPTMGFPTMAFDPHLDATMITIEDNPNGFFGALNNHGGSLLPLLASVTVDTKDTNVPFVTWVPPQHAHLFLGCHLAPRAAAVAGVTAAENNSVRAQAQPFVNWLMVLTHPQNATSPMPWVLFTADVIAPLGDHCFMAWQQLCLGQILPGPAGATSGVGGATSQIATLMGDFLSVQHGQQSDAQAACTAASQP